MNRYHFHIALVLLILAPPSLRADDDNAVLESLRSEILASFGDEAPHVSTSLEENRLQVAYRTRSFLVHGASKTGEWSEEPREVEGPSYRGFRIRFVLQPASFNGAWARPRNDRGATFAAAVPKPYWDERIWVMPLDDREQDVWIYLSHGRRADRAIQERLELLFGEIR